MPPTDKISLKTFWEAVELRLAACSAEQLRAIVRSQAQEVAPNGRRAFLNKLGPIEPGALAGIAREIEPDDLLADIADLAAEIEDAMEEAPEPEEHYEWGGYDEEEEDDDPYAEFVEPLVALFDRAQAAFDYGDQQLARNAYASLFEILNEQDDYGRGIMPTDLTDVDLSEAWARYLRAVYETEPAADRPPTIFSEMLTVRMWVAGARPKLDDLIQITPAPLPDRDKFLAGWIAFLRGQPSEEADTWLREAIWLAHGTAGLEALARGEGKQRPRAYLDWFTALAQEGKHREVLVATQEALDVLPAELPIHAAIADHLCAAAEKLNALTLVRAGRWEAFTAKPTLPRLLDLWEAAAPGDDRTALMRRALQRLQDYLAHPPSRDGMGWRGDDLELPALPSKAALIHACLLAGDLDAAHEQAAREQVLGWSNSENTQGLVVPFFLSLASGRSFAALPPNLAQLWQAGLQTSAGYATSSAGESILPRLQRIYAEGPVEASPSRNAQEVFLAWCLDVARQRVENIVSNQRRGSYGKAAMLTVACTEALRLHGNASGGNAFLETIRTRFPRHSAFQAELRAAIVLMERAK
jgi:tetratricopeptide (TPR) repeat protein